MDTKSQSLSNSLLLLFPEIAKEWHPTKNGNLSPNDVTKASNKKVWWICSIGHDYQATVSHRTNGRKCPYCSGRRVSKYNCLATLNPELAKEWHPTRNGSLKPCDFTSKSGKKVWWSCSKGHEYQSIIKNRTNGSKCPSCSGKKACNDNCLATLSPELAKEWHPTKNGKLTAFHVTKGSSKKVWWKCANGHAYFSSINSRYTRNHGCPYCSGRLASKENCLAILAPELAKEWHPIKNDTLTPFDVTKGSNQKVWWQCLKGHEYNSCIAARTRGNGCPYCSGKKVCNENCLAKITPELIQQWHPAKNGKLTPFDVTRASNKKVWWLCPKGHEYCSSIASRTKPSNPTNCPNCSNQTSRPELRILSELSYIFDEIESRVKIDGYEIDIYLPNEKIGIEYDGSYYHTNYNKDVLKTKYLESKNIKLIRIRENPLSKISSDDIIIKTSITKNIVDNLLHKINANLSSKSKSKRIQNYISKEKFVNNKKFREYLSNYPLPLRNTSLINQFPELAKEWDYDKNFPLKPDAFVFGSDFKVFWKCSRNHQFKASIRERARGTNCSYCSGKKVSNDNCLATLAPVLAQEWHPTKNNQLTPFDVTKGSKKKVWWQCLKGHEYNSCIGDRVRGNGCPYCSGRRASKENCLDTLFPELAQEWHPTKNNQLTPFDVTKGSKKKVWWQCLKGHEYNSCIMARTIGHGCPYCSGKKVCNENCLAKMVPELIQQWHPAKNGKLTPFDVTRASNKKVWWQCPKGHEYRSIISQKTRGHGCPYCSGHFASKENSLATLVPELAQEWHPAKNGKLTPFDVTRASNKKVWWLCPKGHEYYSSIANRSKLNKPTNCPYCSGNKASKDNCLATTFPDIAKEWHPTKNEGLSPNDITKGSGKKGYWLCINGHSYQMTVKNRTKNIHQTKCPMCKKP